MSMEERRFEMIPCFCSIHSKNTQKTLRKPNNQQTQKRLYCSLRILLFMSKRGVPHEVPVVFRFKDRAGSHDEIGACQNLDKSVMFLGLIQQDTRQDGSATLLELCSYIFKNICYSVPLGKIQSKILKI